MKNPDDAYLHAAELIAGADALVIAAGAGMGVDSGLPDFRGNEGFWKAYPALAKVNLDFMEVASPRTFVQDPSLAWGFYGHRLGLYRQTTPHAGFDILRKWGERMLLGSWIFTSNVDGQFQKAGFSEEHIHECHGSIHHLQCMNECEVEAIAPRWTGLFWAAPSPTGRSCGSAARPWSALCWSGVGHARPEWRGFNSLGPTRSTAWSRRRRR